MNVAILGAGNWGTVLAHLVARNGHDARLWTRNAQQRDEINAARTNERAIPGLAIARGVRATTDLHAALADAELVLVAIPSQSFRDVCHRASEALQPDHLVVHASKGLELGTHRRMSEILVEETCVRQLGVLSGPNIAAEVAQGKPAGTVIASHFPRLIEVSRAALGSSRFMIFDGTDVLGIELCGALKNVVAIAAGMADEMQVGDNAKAFLATRGMAEVTRLAHAMGAESATMMGLAGIGDLTVTCASPLSRNHRIGVALARGERLAAAAARLGMVAEGAHAAVAARELARAHGIEMPLFQRVHAVLYENLAPRDALEELMLLPAGHDVARFAATRAPSVSRGMLRTVSRSS